MGRYALLIAAGEYEDPGLSQLRAPSQDVSRLAALLEAPEVGGFDSVEVLQDTTDADVRAGIENILADRLRDDLVLVYFSCHGIVDRMHRLYFAATNTRRARPASTAVSRSFVNEQLESSPARAKVLILDCCFSGAFAEGFKASTRNALDDQLGSGYVVLTASDAYEYSWEGDSIADSSPHASVFTDVLIEGLGGAADLDGDHRIGIDELFRYVKDGVGIRQPNQSPRFWAHDAELNIYLANVEERKLAGIPGRPQPAAVAKRPSNYNRNQVVVARGLHRVSERLRLMLGPLGRRIVFEDEEGRFAETDDPSVFVTRYKAADPRDRLGAEYATEIVQQAHQRAGDGAGTAIVLAQAMVDGAVEALKDGAHPMALARGIEAGVARAIEALAPLARPVEYKEQIAGVVGLAAGDPTAGDIVAEAMDKVGANGVLTVEESNTGGLELEITEGMRLNQGYVSPYLVTDVDRKEAVIEDAYVLIVDGNLSGVQIVLPVLQKVMETKKPLLLIAHNIDGETLATVIVNKVRGTFQSVAVNAPESGAQREALLGDIAALTGGQVLTTDALPGATLESLGGVRKIVVTADQTSLIDGAGDSGRIQARVNRIRADISQAGPGYDLEKLKERLARLAGGVAVIKVGAPTEAALQQRMESYRRSIQLSQVAVADGLLPGGATSLCVIADEVAAAAGTGDQGLGVRIVARSLSAPYRQILTNAGIPADGRLGTQIDVTTDQPADLFAAGIYDGCGVLISALEAAMAATIRFLKIA
ncbi:chaperonin GroEL [Micromonospora sp. C51]|uniref:chaperonin GroEL n=1 Tax=Micromonospora sp. C51 TaxID=2824879 RepID=UPI001B397B9C|nr:chaperonin GroEL [Micromonospora sp. C51]MBQ1049253.1 chaperonin GroEL [Micromonospora sp. C51]